MTIRVFTFTMYARTIVRLRPWYLSPASKDSLRPMRLTGYISLHLHSYCCSGYLSGFSQVGPYTQVAASGIFHAHRSCFGIIAGTVNICFFNSVIIRPIGRLLSIKLYRALFFVASLLATKLNWLQLDPSVLRST